MRKIPLRSRGLLSRILRWCLAAVLLACAAVLLAYRVKDPERRTLDDAARAGAPGRLVLLADGVTHYEAAGPDTGRVVVLAAGFSVPTYIWDSLYQQLADSGFHVIRYDYFGRGWSDRPDAAYDQDFFVRQLAGLLDSLRITTAVDLAGLSFGAAIVTSFADRHPERVRSLIYVDPVFNTGRQLPPEERSALAWNLHMVFRGGTDEMATGQLFDFLRPERHPDWVARYRVQQQFKGTREALRRTRAAIAVAPHQGEQLRRLGAHPRPVLIVWGRDDTVSPFTGSTALLAAMPRARLVPVDSAGHLPHLERPGIVVPAVLRFLNSFVAAVEFGKDSVRAKGVTVGGPNSDPRSKHFNDQADWRIPAWSLLSGAKMKVGTRRVRPRAAALCRMRLRAPVEEAILTPTPSSCSRSCCSSKAPSSRGKARPPRTSRGSRRRRS